ncbi:MAG: hypothetical protein KDK04_31020 [Candidatus Competibacteraceae bacterium]|nr:hypothetical protein [Candidatus Competibacteraceae bacterium]
MPERLRLVRFLMLLILLVAMGFNAGSAFAAHLFLETYRIGLDLDNDPGSGCDFSLGSLSPPTLSGFELQLTAIVDVSTNPPQVASAQLERCTGGDFNNPQALNGFTVTLNNGQLGADSIMGSIPRAFLGDALVVRLAYFAQSADGAEDALIAQDNAPITVLLPLPPPLPADIPALSVWGSVLLSMLFAGLVLWQARRHGSAMLMLVLLILPSVLVYGAFGESLAEDDPSDTTPPDNRAEIIAAFAQATANRLNLRLDIANIETLAGFALLSINEDRYVSVDMVSGELTATAVDADSVFRLFTLEQFNSVLLLRSAGNGNYFTDDFVISGEFGDVLADGVDPNLATSWAIFESMGGIVIFKYLPIFSGYFGVLQVDPITKRLHIVRYAESDIEQAFNQRFKIQP